MKIELTLDPNYCPAWVLRDALREFVSNAKDAEVQFGAKMTIDWYNNTVRIENEGVTLPHEALLLGYTTKRDSNSTIGQWGEGAKIASLVCARSGFPLTIRSGSEVWTPTIEQSEKFNAKVLTFDIAGGRKNQNRVRVEIGNINKEAWEDIRSMFLFLRDKRKKDDTVETNYGTLLLDEEFRGKLFVKGVHINNNPNLSYGYDFHSANLDRDRKMIDSFDQEYYTRRVLTEAVAKRPDLLDSFFALLNSGAKDVAGYAYTEKANVPGVAALVSEKFTEKFGANAVPVTSLEMSRDIEHLGKRGVVVHKALAAVLADVLGTPDTVMKDLANEACRTYSWHELSEEERKNLMSAIDLVTAEELLSLEFVDVVDFRSPNIEGMYKDGRILIAKRMLENRRETLAIIVHEVAHRQGHDGDKSHVAEIERIWAGIVESFRNKAVD